MLSFWVKERNWENNDITFLCVCSLANVDPIDVARNITGLNPETTLGELIFIDVFFLQIEKCEHIRLILDNIFLSCLKLWWSRRLLLLPRQC